MKREYYGNKIGKGFIGEKPIQRCAIREDYRFQLLRETINEKFLGF